MPADAANRVSARVLWWDWREQPDLGALAKILTEVSGGTVHLHEVDTCSDEYAVVISSAPLSAEEAVAAWEKGWEEE